MSTAAKPTNVAHGGADILVAEQRPKKVLSGLNFVVDGIGSLRSHTGSAHGHGAR
jgi:Abortive infection C-terminus